MSNLNDGFLSTIVNIAGAGDNTIVTGVATQKVFVFGLWLWSNGIVTITIKDGAGTSLTGGMALVAQSNPRFDLNQPNNEPWFVTTAGNGLLINLGAGIQISGRMLYKQI